MSDTLDEKRPTRGDARRDAIVQAARKVCLEKGFSKITVSDIASEVGMTRSLFYHYFEDKEAVADAVLDNVIDEILTTLKQWNQARETGNVNKALDDIVHVLRSLIADESPFSNRMIQDGNAELYIKFIDRAADRIADYIAQTTVRDFEQMHGLPKELTQENSMQVEEVLYNLEECLPDLNGEELVSQYSAINVPQNTEGLKSVRNVFKQLKSTMVERITGQQVSDKEIAYENLADTLYQRGAQKKSESISNKVLYNEYLFMEFASYTDYLKEDKTLETQTQKQLDYMLEYILYGKTSDEENLQQGMTELSLMREGVNMAYLLTDSEKKAEAYAVAASLVGFTGNMAAVKAAQYVILGVWAYGESIVELKQLYRGGSIEPVKTRQNWKLSLQELLSMDLNQEYSDEKGLSYEEYLKMLVLLQNEQKKYYRTMSAMEIRMIELGNTDFRLKNYIYGAQSRAAFKIGTIPHSYEKTCSYHYG